MGSLATVLLALVFSVLLAGAVQVQLGVYFKVDVALVLAMVILGVKTLVTALALGIALALARKVALIDAAARALLGLTVHAFALLGFIAGAPQRQDWAILPTSSYRSSS